ncbi:MAG: hypothetical protein IH628_09165 [Proteobacteria bacterium]|nr:hypothetical protein [Pseudomonadota bacterium]
MKRYIRSIILATAIAGAVSAEALSAPLDCKEIFRRCANDCREVFDIGVLKDACTVGCFIGYMNCE